MWESLLFCAADTKRNLIFIILYVEFSFHFNYT